VHERISWRVIYSGTKLKYFFTSNIVGRVSFGICHQALEGSPQTN